MRVRQPAVAGYFYPADPNELRSMLESLIVQDPDPSDAIALIVPHAGYIYSGRAAGKVYGAVRLNRRFIILGPNHTGMGAPLSVYALGSWRTPLGDAPIDEDIASRLLEQCPELEDDTQAHLREHSIEVQIPFLQYLAESFTFVPICVGTSNWSALTSLMHAIAVVLRKTDEPVQLIASTDMSHYIPAREAEKKDALAFEPIRQLNAKELYDTVHRHRLTMCGYLPTSVVIGAAKELGATSAELLVYTHSGERTGDHESVVAYAGFRVDGKAAQ